METKNKDQKDDRHVCRALIEPSTSEDYDFSAVIVPADNKQLRYSGRNDEYFYQVLRADQASIDTSRLDSGLPIFDNHPYDQSAMNTLGITVSYDFTERGLEAKCKFGARADEALKQDVKNGITKTMSIEGDVEEYLITRKPGEIPVYETARWTPDSLHFAPVPNDIGAQIEVQRALKEQLKKTKNIENPEADNSILKSIKTKF